MLLSLASDLHLSSHNILGSEFFLNNNPKTSILILSGDVCEIRQLETFRTSFFDRISNQWETILYIPGNHEFYHSPSYKEGLSELNSFLNSYPNIHLLDNSVKEIEGIIFIGSTLWSSLDNFNPLTVYSTQKGLADYLIIYSEPVKRITPKETFKLYKNNVKYIKTTLKENKNKPVVIITHHAPSLRSIHNNYKGNLFNGAFVSDLDSLIIKNPHIKLWVHGHCHSDFNYYINNKTQIICHPKGYLGENYSNPERYIPELIEI